MQALYDSLKHRPETTKGTGLADVMASRDAGKLHSLLPGMFPRLCAFSIPLCRNQHDAERVLECVCARGLERADQLAPGTAPLS